MKTKEDLIYQSEINAVDSRFNPLKIIIPLGITTWPLVFSFGGFFAVGGLAVLGIAAIGFRYRLVVKDWQGIQTDWDKINETEAKKLWKLTKDEDRPQLKHILHQHGKFLRPKGSHIIFTDVSAGRPREEGEGEGDGGLIDSYPYSAFDTAKGIPPLDIPQLLSQATGIALLGNSGSGKTTLAKAIAGGMQDSQVIILDPEDTDWGSLTVVRDYAAILKQMEILLNLLESRDKTPMVVIVDEVPAIRLYAINEGKPTLKQVDNFLLQFGSRGRKYNKLAIFCSQSGNVKSLGLEGQGDFLENFTLIRLQKIANKYARNLPNQDIYRDIQNIAYPVLMNADKLHLHPNLGHHKTVEKGAKPEGLQPLRSLPLTFPLALSPTSPTSCRDTPPTTTQPASQPVATSWQPVDPTTQMSEVNRANLQKLIDSGWSQNRIIKEFFGISSKGTNAYYDAAKIIREMKGLSDDYPDMFNGIT
ncbi:ATP-binding protein [Spirulina sp. 06S082]|uniref:ATP-binding protein n=1 Tax=Spirulina sp. 06S082 TaxID=3110248 RepID=UPI002B20C065|nr:ATP-binding protein [Spirulina sp. 06S082]MEA5469352.1 ATP-binding protein [Spirulina sp. 06S082]